MSTLITRIASATTTLAMLVMLIPGSAFAQVMDESTNVVVMPATADTTAPASTTPEAPVVSDATTSEIVPQSNAATVAPLATNDGGQFDSFTSGSVNGQGGWSANDSSVDEAIVDNTTGPSSFGLKALRVSNAITSSGFSQIHAPSSADSVGESSASAGTYAVGTRNNHFEMSFDFASAIPNFEQPGLAVTLSPDRGDGSRMSYIKLADTATGTDVIFYDVQGTTNPANFVATTVATGLDRTVAHNVKLTFDAVDGPSNDIVKVYVDGTLVHTGTSWENYYRYDSEASAEQSTRLIKTILIRVNGTAVPTNAGNGYLFDHFSTSAAAVTPTPALTTTTVVRAADLGTSRTATSTKWFFYNDNTDVVDNTLGSFVAGPATAPAGTGSAQMTATSSQKIGLATTGKSGTRLADITALQYSTYRSVGDPAVAPSLQFDFDNDPNVADSAYLGRLVYEPYFTQDVASNTWQTWDTLNDTAGNGTGNWWFSRAANTGALAVAPTLASCAQSNPCTWAEVKAAFPNGAIANYAVGGGFFGFRTGGSGSLFTGNVDKLVFGTYASGTETVDFDNDAAPVTTPTPVQTGLGQDDGIRSGGGGGGGGFVTPVTTTTGTTNTGGQVLGAATFNFTTDLHIGSRGTDVTELQTELIAAGYSIPYGATGYFGVQTRAAVAMWQKANGVVPPAGYFGPISRAKYVANGSFGTTPVTIPVVTPVVGTTTITTSATTTTTTSSTTMSH